MRQLADLYRGDFAEIVGAEYLHLVHAADRDIGELAPRIAHDIDVVGDRTGIERLEQGKGRLRVEHLGLAGILQCEPDLSAVRGGGDIRAKGARLLYLSDDFVIGDRYDVG